MKKNPIVAEYIRDNRKWVFLLLFITMSGGWIRGIGASWVGKITNHIAADGADGLLPMCITGYFCISLFYAGRTSSAGISAYLAEKLSRETRIKIFRYLNRISFREYEQYGAGRLQSIMYNDVAAASELIYIIFARILNNLFLFVFSVYHMFIADVKATIIVVVLAVSAALLNKMVLNYMQKPQQKIRSSIANLTELTESVFLSMDTIKILSAKQFVLHVFHKEKEIYNDNQMRSERIDAGRLMFYNLLDNLSFYISMIYLGHLAISGKMDLGTVFMFIYLIKQIFVPINTFFRCMSAIVKSNAAWARIYELLAIGGTEVVLHTGEQKIDNVIFESVNFNYGEHQNILNHVRVELHRNKINLLIGESGSGKSTLLKIISGLYPCPDAVCYCDGGRQQGGSLKGRSGFAPSDGRLFCMSIYDNIALGDLRITREMCTEVIEELGFGLWLQSLPAGLDTMVEEKARNFSGGQGQMIGNVRAILGRQPVLILDEPFSALDKEREQRLINKLRQMQNEKIILITSHRRDIIDESVNILNF